MSKLFPIEQIFGLENFVIVRKENIDQEPSTKISNPSVSVIDATEFGSSVKVQDNSINHQISYNNFNNIPTKHAKTTWAGSDAGQICL